MKKTLVSIMIASLITSGCATVGETARSKILDRVDPISIEDMDKYGQDVNTCEKIAVNHAKKRANQEIGAMIAGALIGAAFGAAVTPNGYGIRGDMARFGAGVGAGSALGAAGNRTLNEQDRLIANCMTNRGYKILF